MPLTGRKRRSAARFVCIGAGGHGRSVVDLFGAGNKHECVGFLDPDPALKGTSILGYTVLGGEELLAGLRKEKVSAFLITFGTTGERQQWRRRAEKFHELKLAGLVPLSLVHESAKVSRYAHVGQGTVIMSGAVVNAGAHVGDNVIVNSGAIVEHDCTVGDHSHIATGTILCGRANISEGVHVGAGAVVLQNVQVGADSIIGAGAVVTRAVRSGTLVVGIPARIRL